MYVGQAYQLTDGLKVNLCGITEQSAESACLESDNMSTRV